MSSSTLFDTYKPQSVKVFRKKQQQEIDDNENLTVASSSSSSIPSPLSTRPTSQSYQQSRPLFIQPSIISSAIGSSYIEISPHTKIFASCYAPIQISTSHTSHI